jgi:hypothetical protein
MSFNKLSTSKYAPGKDDAGDRIKAASAAGEPSAQPGKAPAGEPASPQSSPAS